MRGGETAGWGKQGDSKKERNKDEIPDKATRTGAHYATAAKDADTLAPTQANSQGRNYHPTAKSQDRDVARHHVSTSAASPQVYDSWLLDSKVRTPWLIEEDVGDSCCFGTRTVDVGTAWIWDT